MKTDRDPIIAKASAAGRGGIGIVRISGSEKDITAVTENLFGGIQIKPRHATLLTLNDTNGSMIDRAIILRFVTPASYTGEAVLEIQAHAGSAVQQLIVDRCLEAGHDVGLRYAEAGEFSKRAFLNGRMDLTQAEAVADLIDASSKSAARAAARSMQGEFSKKVTALNDKVQELRAYIEATIDFPEEEIDFIQTGHVNEKLGEISAELTSLQKSAMRGKVLRDGLTVVLVGAPNVGKSSLMNTLAGEDVAIVTDVAGTTRDRIAYPINLDGMTVNLIDTAGVRETDDPVERIGVERTLESVGNADVVIHLLSAGHMTGDDSASAMAMIAPRLREGVEFLTAVNKMDLLSETDVIPKGALVISAKFKKGIDELVERLKTISGMNDSSEGEFLARSRHLDCLAKASEHIAVIDGEIGPNVGLDIAAEELRLCSRALGDIVGQTLPDDILGMIFSKFCIGK